MWIETRIFVACVLMGASAMAHAGLDVIYTSIALAPSCTADTPQSDKVGIPIAASMIGRDVLPKAAVDLCIVRDVRIDLSVAAIDTNEDKWKVGSVEIAFAPDEDAAFNKFMRENAGKKLVLLHGGNAILDFEILRATHQKSLILRGFSLDDAEAIKKAILVTHQMR
jgi:hypothetical protein